MVAESVELGAQLAAFRLASAALPIGAFAYSQGLEMAVGEGIVHDSDSAQRWILGILRHSVLTLDVPLLTRLHAAWAAGSSESVEQLSQRLLASRPTRELREEERQLGGALFRWLARLGVARAEPWLRKDARTLAAAFALAADHFRIPATTAAASYTFAWSEAQIGSVTRLVPLGQTDAQRVLHHVLAACETELAAALELPEERIAASTPFQALLSAAHETQYSRLFRS